MDSLEKIAADIRSFNRSYLPFFHLLTQKYRNSDHSVSEACIMYEIYASEPVSASEICSRPQLDKGYLSRILRRFEDKGIIERESSEQDLRCSLITLTAAGKELAEGLMELSNQQVAACLAVLKDKDIERLAKLLSEAAEILGGTKNGNN